MKKLGIGLFLIIAFFTIYSLISNADWLPFTNGIKKDEVALSKDIHTIEIEGSSASLQVVVEKRDNVHAVLEGKGDVSVEKNGKTIAVEYTPPTFNTFSFFNRNKVTIYIPESFDQNLEFDIGSGNLNFSSSANQPLNLKELIVDISSGNVKIEHVHAEVLESDVSSGNVSLRNVTADKGKISVRSGNTTVKQFVGSFDATVSSGNLEVEMNEVTGDIKMQVNSGRATLKLPKNADVKVDGSINSGHLSNGFSFDQIREERRSIEATHGKGTHSVELNVSSGQIKLH